MKILNFPFVLSSLIAIFFLSSCYKLQKDYNYVRAELDPHINMTAKDYLLLRGTAGANNDTVFKWMQLGIEYSGIDLSEYEKPGRTYLFLHNSAIKTVSSGKVNGGFFFDYPIIVKDAAGNAIKSKIDPTIDSTRPAVLWSEYPKEMVKNYLLYLIINGEYGFNNLTIANQTLSTLLPAGSVVSPKDSKLGWVRTQTAPNPDVTATTSITMVYPTGGTGFDPEGKINLKVTNNDVAPITVNDRTNDRSAGYLATNGQLHVFGSTVHPFRYSY